MKCSTYLNAVPQCDERDVRRQQYYSHSSLSTLIRLKLQVLKFKVGFFAAGTSSMPCGRAPSRSSRDHQQSASGTREVK
jgi:hypothetical protein